MGRFKATLWTISKLFPRISVSLLLCWSYYAIIWKLLLRVPEGFPKYGTFLAVLVTVCCGMSLWTYHCVLCGPGSPCDIPMLVVPNYREDENGDPIRGCGDDEGQLRPPGVFVENSMMCKSNGGFRFCSKCKCWKPDRSHHCSSCERCILKMDHHCPWFGECIGFHNYRYFVQFLVWSEAYLAVVTWMSCWSLFQFFVYERWPLADFSFHVLFVFCLGALFSICLCFFAGFTVYQLLRNKTTIESYEMQRYRNRNKHRHNHGRLANIFDLGWRRNWIVVMGNTVWKWLLPLGTVDHSDLGFLHRPAAAPATDYSASTAPVGHGVSLGLNTPSDTGHALYQMGVCFPVAREFRSNEELVERLSGEFTRWART